MQKYFINIQDRFSFDDGETSVELLLELTIYSLNFSLQLFVFSNSEQKGVLLENSLYVTDLPKKSYLQIYKYYTKVANNFLEYLRKNITTQEKLKEFIFRVEKPRFIFHTKLLNVFTQEDLEFIAQKYFKYYPILNLKDFSQFLPIEINGWYLHGIEIDTDLDENNVPHIEDKNGKIISPSELLKILKDVE